MNLVCAALWQLEGILMLLTAFSRHSVKLPSDDEEEEEEDSSYGEDSENTFCFNITFLFLIKRKINFSAHLFSV